MDATVGPGLDVMPQAEARKWGRAYKRHPLFYLHSLLYTSLDPHRKCLNPCKPSSSRARCRSPWSRVPSPRSNRPMPSSPCAIRLYAAGRFPRGRPDAY